MQATTSSTFAAAPVRRIGLIAAAVLAAAALAAGAASFLDSGPASAPAANPIAPVPVGSVEGSSDHRDPSVPSAASVFRDRPASPEEPMLTF